ncbi:MAG: tRNA (adenosine(37)-N6)-threonylcarbamoyltransferase complex dimerization subunit type 1 TsaB [Mucilaginibacter sp.]
MSIILQIETATTACSVALTRDGKVMGLKQIDQRNIHAEVITLFIDELLKANNLVYTELDAIAVSSGPGSYTGLRIGISTAKGLCFALDKPLIAIETLTAMADGLREGQAAFISDEALLCPMIDARRMEVYTALFTAHGQRVKPTTAEIIDENSFSAELQNGKVIFFGDGAEKCRETLGVNPNAVFLPGFVNSASYLSKKAFEKLATGEFEDVAYFEPFYLKDFIAGKKKV